MKKFKKICMTFLFPHIAVLISLTPFSIGFLIYAMLSFESDSLPAILSYALSAYILALYCVRIPRGVRFFKALQKQNRLIKRMTTDAHFRIELSLLGSFLLNASYALLQFGFGVYERSLWYIATAAYYFLLAVMRIYLLSYTRRHEPGADQAEEYRRYRFCGIVLLILNLALSAVVTDTVLSEGRTNIGMIPTIAMAAYTFAVLTVAIVNVFRYRKYQSPVFTAAKYLNLATAVVSMLTLESAMLTAFDEGNMGENGKLIFMAVTGFSVMAFTLGMAVYMIVCAGKKRTRLSENTEDQ